MGKLIIINLQLPMKLAIQLKKEYTLLIHLKQGRKVIDHQSLTISTNLDTLLITAIDKLLAKNRIERLSLKKAGIKGKFKPGAVSSMIIKTVVMALQI